MAPQVLCQELLSLTTVWVLPPPLCGFLHHLLVGSLHLCVAISPPSSCGSSLSTLIVGTLLNFLKIPKFYPKKLSYISTIYHPMSFSISLAGLEFNLELNHRIQLGSGLPSDQPIFRFPALSLFSRRLSQVFFGEWVFLIWMGIDLLLIGYMVAFL